MCQYYSNFFTNVISFNPHSNPIRKALTKEDAAGDKVKNSDAIEPEARPILS